MGPQLYRCGNVSTDRVTCTAAPASMEPQLYRCGNHDRLHTHGNVLLVASMGPQLYRCGNAEPRLVHEQVSHASMGPQLYRCGNLPPSLPSVRNRAGFNGAATLSLRKYNDAGQRLQDRFALQWGRNFIIAEMGRYSEKADVTLKSLQWGRNFIVAEISSCRGQMSFWMQCFNGAATLSLRKCPYSTLVGGVFRVASMGPQLYRCGNMPLLHANTIPPPLQWGRNFIVAEMGISTIARPSGVHASMGPQLYRCGNP